MVTGIGGSVLGMGGSVLGMGGSVLGNYVRGLCRYRVGRRLGLKGGEKEMKR
jgi:hypothetical protein